MFDCKPTKIDAPSEFELNRKARRLQVLNWIPSEIARQPAKLEEYKEKLAEDIATFSIKFERYGDFVAVFMKRAATKSLMAVPLGRFREPAKVFAAGAAPIPGEMLPGSIVLVPGAAPGLEGRGYATEGVESGTFVSFASPPNSMGFRGMLYNYDNRIEVPIDTGLALRPKDDVIHFQGAALELAIPVGCGEQAYRDLLMALQAGAPDA